MLAPPTSAWMEERRTGKGRRIRREMKKYFTPSEAQTSHLPTIVDGSDEETDEDVVDVTAREEWIARVEMAR